MADRQRAFAREPVFERPERPERPERRDTCLDRRLAMAPADPRMRMRRCELLPRPDPAAGAGPRVWTFRAGRLRTQ